MMARKVLVCDDDWGLLPVLSDIFKTAGYSVETASDGIEAISKAIRSQPAFFDLILIDHVMPGLDGLGLVREIRNCNIPGKIIVLSGNLDARLEADFSRLAVDKILSKPNGITELTDCAAALFPDSGN